VGWHKSQVGTVLTELVPVALPDDPLDVAAAVVDCAADAAPAEPVLTVPDDDPEAAAVADEAVVVVVLVEATVPVVGLLAAAAPRLTTPFCVTVPGVTVVCAAAGDATATDSISA
jgi:hypothetical protein